MKPQADLGIYFTNEYLVRAALSTEEVMMGL